MIRHILSVSNFHRLSLASLAGALSFPVKLMKGVGGSLLCYVAAPDGVSIELMQC